jgi:YD repeat-containing protein
LHRATKVVFSRAGTSEEAQSFVYDGGAVGAPNAKGRLTQITDAAAVTSWTYNGQGRVASKSAQVGAVTKTISYGYNAAGQLTTVTTPSGQQLGYSYLNNRVTALTVNGQSLVGGAVAEPFGALGAWQWGNGLFTFRDYDQDGRLADWEFRNGASLLRQNLSYDPASRVVGLADPNVPAQSQSYQYDVLDRLSVAQRTKQVDDTRRGVSFAVWLCFPLGPWRPLGRELSHWRGSSAPPASSRSIRWSPVTTRAARS